LIKWEDLFDDYGIKTVSSNDKKKKAYVLDAAQRRVIAAAGIMEAKGRAFPISVLFDKQLNTVVASYYFTKQPSKTKHEARMGREFITSWLNVGDEVVIGIKTGKLYVAKVAAANVALAERRAKEADDGPRGGNSASAASESYVRYIQAYEIEVSPEHDKLQKKFEAYIEAQGARNLMPNRASVDLQFDWMKRGRVLAEIKPCEPQSARYAIRTAMGQLLDYRQRDGGTPALLVVLGTVPGEEDLELAIGNGFGVAYPTTESFQIRWPT
jgi:hypothetical protein